MQSLAQIFFSFINNFPSLRHWDTFKILFSKIFSVNIGIFFSVISSMILFSVGKLVWVTTSVIIVLTVGKVVGVIFSVIFSVIISVIFYVIFSVSIIFIIQLFW